MRREFRCGLPLVVAILGLAGCAAPEATRPPESRIVFRPGAGSPGPGSTPVHEGPPLRRLAVLVPALEPVWQAAWPGSERKGSGGGAAAGFLSGLAIVQSSPIALLFWPAAVGVLAGTTALGALGEQAGGAAISPMDVEDRAALTEAVTRLQPDRILREAVVEALAGRTGSPPVPIPWQPTWGPDTPGTDPLADAQKHETGGLLELAVEALGLTAGEETETFGIFVRVRARLLEAPGGGLRYERVLEHGPGRRVAGLPRPSSYTIGFLAADRGQVFRQEARETIVRLARVVAEDPALPVAPR